MLATCASGAFQPRPKRSVEESNKFERCAEGGWVSVHVDEVSFLLQRGSSYWLHDSKGVRQVVAKSLPWWKRWYRGGAPQIKGLEAYQWWRLSNVKEVEGALQRVESCLTTNQHRVGVLQLQGGQSSETEALSNNEEVDLTGIASKITLAGWQGFRGGLDLTGGSGKYAYYRQWNGQEFIFHVPALMPDSLIERKRHVGNDLVLWVQLERGAIFDLDTIQSRQNLVVMLQCDEILEIWARPECGEIHCDTDDFFEIFMACEQAAMEHPWQRDRVVRARSLCLKQVLMKEAKLHSCLLFSWP